MAAAAWWATDEDVVDNCDCFGFGASDMVVVPPLANAVGSTTDVCNGRGCGSGGVAECVAMVLHCGTRSDEEIMLLIL